MNAAELSIGTRLFLAAAVSIAVGGIVAGVVERETLQAVLDAASRSAAALGVAGWVLMAALQMAAALLGVIPGSLLGAAAGAVFGPVTGFLISATALMAAAAAAFLLSRTWLKPAAERLAQRYAKAGDVSQLIAADGWRLVCLIRLSPVLPFAPTSYLLGLSRLSFGAYMTGTLASLPALLGYVLIGHATVGGARADSFAELVQAGALVLGLVATVGLTLYIGKRAGQILAGPRPA